MQRYMLGGMDGGSLMTDVAVCLNDRPTLLLLFYCLIVNSPAVNDLHVPCTNPFDRMGNKCICLVLVAEIKGCSIIWTLCMYNSGCDLSLYPACSSCVAMLSRCSKTSSV